ncbi:MAG: DUF1080 domain-containing protein [Marinilabiliales bacterium]|nr:DUF1080 domain-containing protein [Marinilabiliales bacterium]
MKRDLSRLNLFLLLAGAILCLNLILPASSCKAQETAPQLEGRWDLTLVMNGEELPSWLEVTHSGFHTLVGRFVYANGSARPISKVTFDGTKFGFVIPPQWENETRDLVFEGSITSGGIEGTMVFVDGKRYNWKGVRAPLLKRSGEPVFGEPQVLFNGVDLKGWHATGPNQWKVVNGVLTSEKSGSNLVTDQTFNDFQLHIEFRYQKGSNSGVYLRGRYEVQIMDSKGMEPWVGYLGAIYGFLTPSEMVAKDPGVWQSYDITLRGRMVTIIGNNKLILYNQEIPGITGGAINSKEAEPGPLLLQGDHGPIEYRNIILTPIQ